MDAYARTQADGLDNIAPTPLQGQQAWQYVQSDNFFSPEEQSSVMRKQLEPYQAQLESKLAAIGWGRDHLAKHPAIANALFSGNQSVPLEICVTPRLKMEGCLRIAMTENGPDIRFTPRSPGLTIPNEVAGVRLTEAERQQLSEQGSLSRPLLLMEKGEYVPTYLRLEPASNSVELWRVKPDQLPTKVMGIDLTRDQQMQLASGRPIRLSGLLDKQGEPFEATVSISASKQALQFTDLNRLDLGLKPEPEKNQQFAQNNEGAKTDLVRGREVEAGATGVSHRQSEVIKQLLESEPEQKAISRGIR